MSVTHRRWNLDKSRIVPDMTTCQCHIERYHVYVSFYMYHLSEYILTNVGYLQHMVQEEQLQIKASYGCRGQGGGCRSDIKAEPT